MHNQIRIIGGKHRGRKVSFPNTTELRPTPDRVRETLFNWIAPVLPGANCLDLFSGSGILGLEAISRGAASVMFVEKNKLIANNIEHSAGILGDILNCQIIQANVISWLATRGTSYDVVFLDPPYQSNLLPTCFELLDSNGWIQTNSYIYFESDKPQDPSIMPITWRLYREKKAGHVYYYLAQKY